MNIPPASSPPPDFPVTPASHLQAGEFAQVLKELEAGLGSLLPETGSVFTRIYRLVDRQLLWRRQLRLYELARHWKANSALSPMIPVLMQLMSSIMGERAARGAGGKVVGVRVVDRMLHDRAVASLTEAWTILDEMTQLYKEVLARNLLKEAPEDLCVKSRALVERIQTWDRKVGEFFDKKGDAPAN